MEDKKSKKELIIQVLWVLFGIGTIALSVFYIGGSYELAENDEIKVIRVIELIMSAVMVVFSLIWWRTRKNPERKTLRVVLFTILSEFIISAILYFASFAVLATALHPIEMIFPCLYLIFAVPWYALFWILIKLNSKKKKIEE